MSERGRKGKVERKRQGIIPPQAPKKRTAMSSEEIEQLNERIENVLGGVRQERYRQLSLWGDQDHDSHTWLVILMEEVGEAAKTILADVPDYELTENIDKFREELIQVAAVAVAAVECIDRRYEHLRQIYEREDSDE